MKRFVITLLAILSALPSLEAQSVRQMNMIKRNSQYIYAEATMETSEEAYKMAYERLLSEVKTYAQSKKQLSEENNIAIRNISSKCESIEMQRGEMYKVFLYVKKSDIEDAANITILVSDENKNKEEVVSIGGEWALPAQGQGQSTQLVKQETVKAGTNVNTGMSESSAPKPVGTAAKLSEAWKQNAIEQLMNAPSFAEARVKMGELKRDYKIKKFGRPAECTDWDAAFWLIGDANGQVVTVLGPEEGGRTDFKNLVKTSLDAYSGYYAVWFTLYK